VLSLLSLLAVAVGPSPAAAADAALYEVFENMAMVRRDGHDYREGWAALIGTARPGTLLCPLAARCEIVSIPGRGPDGNARGSLPARSFSRIRDARRSSTTVVA